MKKLEHTGLKTPKYATHRWTPKAYGQQVHLDSLEDTSEILSETEKNKIQRVVGSFLYYARAINNTIHIAINDIAAIQASPTNKTKDTTIMLMDYLHTHPNAKIRYLPSDIQLYVDSDAAYLVATKAKSRITGHFYLSDQYNTSPKIPGPRLNGPAHIECQLLKHVLTSASEAETSGVFLHCKAAIGIKKILEALGHSQKIIPLKIDNSAADDFNNSTLKKRSKVWYMCLYWIKDQVTRILYLLECKCT